MTSRAAVFLVLGVVCLGAVFLDAASIHTKRSVKEENNEQQTNSTVEPTCRGENPCGWAVYKPFTRRIDYYMRNTCLCPKEKPCRRTEDDLSVSAFVYRCRSDPNLPEYRFGDSYK